MQSRPSARRLLDFAGAMLHRFGMSEGPGTASHASAARPVGVLLSVNVGLPKDVSWQGKTVFTGVFKDPVSGPRRVRKLNLDGDGQGDLAGHGGEQRAVFVYQIDSYRYWERELGRNDFVHGQFGENFTIEGLSDDEVCIGDRYRIGTASFEVTQPRVTCYRVGIRMNDPRIPALLVSHRRPGFYFRVLEEGEVQAGDEIVKLASGSGADDGRGGRRAPLSARAPAPELLRALRIPALSPGWQASFRALLEGGSGSGNAGLAVTSPPPLWPGFRRLTVAEIDRESDSMISDPPRRSRRRSAPGAPSRPVPDAPRPARSGAEVAAPQLLALGPARCRLLPDHRQARARRCRQRLSAHPPRRRRPARDRSAARHLHPRPHPGSRTADQRRHRRNSGPRHAACSGAGAFRAGGLVAARRAQQPRPPLRRRSPHAPRLAPERPLARLLQPPGRRRPRRPRLRRHGPSHGVAARRARATARRRGIPLRADSVHGRDQRRPGGDGDRRRAHPHRALRARAGSHTGHRRNARADAPPARR